MFLRSVASFAKESERCHFAFFHARLIVGVDVEHRACIRRLQFEEEKKLTEDEERQLQLEGRIRPLRAMYRETRDVARHLEGYYARTDPEKRRKRR